MKNARGWCTKAAGHQERSSAALTVRAVVFIRPRNFRGCNLTGNVVPMPTVPDSTDPFDQL